MQTNPQRKPIKKNYAWLTLFAVLFIGVVVLAVLLLKKDTPKPKAQDDAFSLFKITSPLESVEVSLDNGTSYTLYKNENNFYLKGDDETPIKDDVAKTLESYLSDVIVQEKISDDTQSESFFKLSPPHIGIKAHYVNNEVIDFSVGAQVPLSPNFYFSTSKVPGTFAVHEGFESLFFQNPRSFLKTDDVHFNQFNIKALKFLGKNPMSISVQTIENERAYGTVQTTFSYPADAKKLYAMLNALHTFNLGILVGEYKGEKSYGFESENLSLEITEDRPNGEKTSTLTFGKKEDDFFIYVLHNGTVYKASYLAVQSLVDVGNDIFSKHPFALSLLDVSNLLVVDDDFNGTKTTWQVATEVEQDETKVSISKNGKPFSLEVFKNYLSFALKEAYDEFLGQTKVSEKPRRHIHMVLRSGEYNVAFIDASPYEDYIAVNGVVLSKWAKQKTNALFEQP